MLATLSPILSIFWRSSYRTILLVLLVVALAAVTSILAPYLFSRQIDLLTTETAAETALVAFFWYAILMGASLALDRMVQYLSVLSAENLSLITGKTFFSRLTSKTPDFFIRHNSAEIQTALRQGETVMGNLVNFGLIVVAPGILKLGLALFVMGAVINLEIAIIVFAYGVCFVGLTYWVNNWTQKNIDKAIEATQENSKFVGNAIAAMETLRQFNSLNWVQDQFQKTAENAFKNWRLFSYKRMTFAGVFGIALTTQFAITFYFLIPELQAGELSVGDIVLFNALLLQLNLPFEMLGMAIDEAIKSRSKLKPFCSMWNARSNKEVAEDATLVVSQGCIECKSVGYTYDTGASINDISFTLSRGYISFLIGPTGSGKSTLFKLLLKSIEPDTGAIYIDGQDLQLVRDSNWFSKIGVVPQDIVLLNDTLENNILLGRELDRVKLNSALKKAAIYNRIEELPDGLETNVGERGLKLSGGERQRIAIARALYAEPEILFLDEASSALDGKIEDAIMQQLRKIAQDVTIVAITHRLGIIQPQDTVIDLAKFSDKENSEGRD